MVATPLNSTARHDVVIDFLSCCPLGTGSLFRNVPLFRMLGWELRLAGLDYKVSRVRIRLSKVRGSGPSG